MTQLAQHFNLPATPPHAGWLGTVRGDRARYTTPQDEPYILAQLNVVWRKLGQWTNVRMAPHACGRGDLETRRAEIYDGAPTVQRIPGPPPGSGFYSPGDIVGPNDRERPPYDPVTPAGGRGGGRRRVTTPERPRGNPTTPGGRVRPNWTGTPPGGSVPAPTTPGGPSSYDPVPGDPLRGGAGGAGRPGGAGWPRLPSPTTGDPNGSGRGTAPAGDNVPVANMNATPWWHWFWPMRGRYTERSAARFDDSSDPWRQRDPVPFGTVSPFSLAPIQHGGGSSSVSMVQINP